jgi:hypothetical protein
MGFRLKIETDGNEQIYLKYAASDLNGGKPLSSFVGPLATYCSPSSVNEKADIQAWFSKLEHYARQPLCNVADPLLHWLEPDSNSGNAAETPWFDAHHGLNNLHELFGAFERANMEATWWCEPEWLLADFRALVQAVDLAIMQGAKRIKLIIF